MIELKDLQNLILNNKLTDCFYIMVNSENSFLANQYIDAIADLKNISKVYIDDLNSLLPDENDIFGVQDTIDNNLLYIYKTTEFDYKNFKIKDIANLIVVCDKLDDESKDIFNPYIIKMPKLLEWQIKDYVYTIGQGIDTKKLDWLCFICNNDIYRLTNELEKLKVFQKADRDYMFDLFVEEDMYSDLSTHHIFDLSSAILKKDIKTIETLLEDRDKWDLEPLGLNVLLCKNFKQVLQIQLGQNMTADKLGLTSKQYYAISKNNCGHYNKDKLLKIFDLVTAADYRMKMGEISNDILVDYMILNILAL